MQQSDAGEKIKNMETRKERLLTIRFNADKSATMQWSFKPQQSEVKVIKDGDSFQFNKNILPLLSHWITSLYLARLGSGQTEDLL